MTRTGQFRERAEASIPGGVNSTGRAWRPTAFFQRARGAWIWDVEGRRYLDYVLGQGPLFLGHAHQRIDHAVTAACREGMIYGAQHPMEVEAAERLLAVAAWPELVRFGSTGTEMIQAALRLARAVSGRDRVVRFAGSYHGWLDNVLMPIDGRPVGPASAGQLAHHLDDWVVLPFNDREALNSLFEKDGDSLAAVIAEPMMCDAAVIPPEDGYLERLRSLCDEHGVVLIFDEVITGFRLAAGGAAEHFGVVPDLAVYSKAVSNGWPAAALAGRGEVMERLGATDVVHSGTMNGSVMATAAILATMHSLQEDPPYERVRAHGTALIALLENLAAAHDLPLRVQGLPAVFHASLGADTTLRTYSDLEHVDREGYRALAHGLVEAGVWVTGRGTWFVSGAHDDNELTVAERRLARAFERLTTRLE